MKRRLALATALIGLYPVTATAHPGHNALDHGPLHVVSDHGLSGVSDHGLYWLALVLVVVFAIWIASRILPRILPRTGRE